RIVDKINNPADLGRALRELRKRLERGDDVYVSSLVDALRAMGYSIRLEKKGLPSLAEMQDYAARELGEDSERWPGHARAHQGARNRHRIQAWSAAGARLAVRVHVQAG